MKKCLIVVDYQNDFVSGTLGFPKAITLEPRIAEKIKEYKHCGDDVLFTFDTHDENYLNSAEGKCLPVAHCIKGTVGHELFGDVAKLMETSDKAFYKSTFGSDELYRYLKSNSYSAVELVGVITNICVISNAILAKTACPETKIIVDSACVASNDDALNCAALAVMESMQITVKNKDVA